MNSFKALLLFLVLAVSVSFSQKTFAQSEEESSSGFDLKMHMDEPDEFQTNWKLRLERKVGLGFGVGGHFGDYGFQTELNFEDENGVVAGFGKSPGFQAFHMLWKHVFEGQYVTPYTVAGYSRWYNSAIGSYNGNAILDGILNASEKATGQFSADFVSGGAGMQYYQLSGDYKGLSFYGEVNLLFEMRKAKVAPTASLGTTYYF